MGQFIDLIGRRFSRWQVVAKSDFEGNGIKPQIHWICRCDCGNTGIVAGNTLNHGTSRSCGCLQKERVQNNANRRTHGGSDQRLYRIWVIMRQRCSLPSNNRYQHYGARGIRVVPEWDNNYEAFRQWAYLAGYDETAPRGKCTIDRINVNGNYCPDNCRWADMKVQANNKQPRGVE